MWPDVLFHTNSTSRQASFSDSVSVAVINSAVPTSCNVREEGRGGRGRGGAGGKRWEGQKGGGKRGAGGGKGWGI